jgi:hypothetical protein
MSFTDFVCDKCRRTLIRLLPQPGGGTVAIVLHSVLSFDRLGNCDAICRVCGAITGVILPERVAQQLRYYPESSSVN